MTSSENDLKDINSSLSSLKSIEDNDKKIYSKNDLNNHLNEIKSVLRDKERGLYPKFFIIYQDFELIFFYIYIIIIIFCYSINIYYIFIMYNFYIYSSFIY